MARHEWEFDDAHLFVTDDGGDLDWGSERDGPWVALNRADLAKEILRLSSPEAAWETVAAFHRGAMLVSADKVRELLSLGYDPSPDWMKQFRAAPWLAMDDQGEKGLALLAECLRLGREAK